MIGSNILKRTIEHMSAGPFDSAREQAMDILNAAIETCFSDEAEEEGQRWADEREPESGKYFAS
jgi:hypothetical protein